MVVVGEREEALETARTNLDTMPSGVGLSNRSATMNVSSQTPELPRKTTRSLAHSEQDYILNTNREPLVPIRDFWRDTSPTFHEYVNIETRSLAEHRQVFDIRRMRNDSFDSTEESYSARYLTRFYGEYECMSSPDSLSTPSSNRSSNTSSLAHGSSSPDSASLSSFTDRFIFGRSGEGKRCSRASTASQESRSSKSSIQSWPGRTAADGFDITDGCSTASSRWNTYENVPQQGLLLRKNRAMMSVASLQTSSADENARPPPLPARSVQTASPTVDKPAQVELILPYKVVDLEELQRSLNDIETYDNSSNSDDDNELYSCPSGDSESQPRDTQLVDPKCSTKPDSRPALPPKRKTLGTTLSDSVIPTQIPNGEVTKIKPEKPTPLPRQSAIFKDTGLNKQTSVESDHEESHSLNRSCATNGHLSRQGSLSSRRVGQSRRQSTSPHRTARPQRSAPPPPPPPSSSHHGKGPSTRPVSEMLPRNQSWNQFAPTDLKRSNTVSMVQFPSSTDTPPSLRNRYSVQAPISPPLTAGSGSPPPCQADLTTKEENGKLGSSKSGAFFTKSKALRKALTKAVTKKPPKKEMVIGPPTDFTSLYQPRVTTERPDRERKTVSFLDSGELVDEDSPGDVEAEKCDDEEVYHNFPISQADDCPDDPVCPKKPPRRFTSPDLIRHDGYLQPSTSQWTRDQEEEISQNKTPELGPLPTTPVSNSDAEEPPTLDLSEDRDNISVKNENSSSVETHVVKTAKPKVPRRPEGLKPKLQKKPQIIKTTESHTTETQDPVVDASITSTATDPATLPIETAHDTTSTWVAERSRSCETLEKKTSSDCYLTSLYLTVLKDILLRWRNMLRRPKISLSGACWEDFEIVEGGSWPKVSEDHASVLQPVRLRNSSLNLDSSHSDSHFIAKIKSQTNQTCGSKSCYDQDYSVCSIVESHENVARILAYFRGDISPQVVGLEDSTQDFHTTISITDQVPTMTCDELVAKSVDLHNSDPYSYERIISLLVLQCLLGLEHLHNTGFAHGNLVLSNLFLIKHANDFQLFLGNLGRSQPLPKERRRTGNFRSNSDGDPNQNGGVRSDLSAVSDLILAMLHLTKDCDQNGNLVKCRTSPLSELLCKVSARLRVGTTNLRQAVGFVRAFLWGPFKLDETCVLSETQATMWLDRQRGEFVAKLAMDECLARTVSNQHKTRFSMEDFLLCDYLSGTQPKYLMETAKCWFYDT